MGTAIWGGEVYLSYSGGLDSTVLLHMIRRYIGDQVPAVFSNTGLEFPEIVRFARKAKGEFVEIYPRDKTGKRISYRDIIVESEKEETVSEGTMICIISGPAA